MGRRQKGKDSASKAESAALSQSKMSSFFSRESAAVFETRNELRCVCQPVRRWHKDRIVEIGLSEPHLQHPVIPMEQVKASALAVRQSIQVALLWESC
eukprot:3624574-Rhodomonas_salina.1